MSDFRNHTEYIQLFYNLFLALLGYLGVVPDIGKPQFGRCDDWTDTEVSLFQTKSYLELHKKDFLISDFAPNSCVVY